jgi:hypothetical protein
MIRTVVLAGALACAQVFAPFSMASASDSSVADDGKRKINLSGRQRMLSQRMAKAVCFAAIGIQTDSHIEMASDAHDLFDRTLDGLRNGDGEQGLSAEKNPRILTELASVEELWSEYGAAIKSALGGKTDALVSLELVARLNLPTLKQMNKAVGEFERHYGSSGTIHPSLALALNISGRQRMLSQKASKEFCLILSGTAVDANRAALSETVALFERSLLGLMDGDDDLGLPEAPTDEIYEQLEVVMGLWTPLRDILSKVASGESPTANEIETVARDNNPLLVEMNKAVWMYDNI